MSASPTPPRTPEEWDHFREETDPRRLIDLGLIPYSGFRNDDGHWVKDPDSYTHVLLLFPRGWYHAIPSGLGAIDVRGVAVTFDAGKIGMGSVSDSGPLPFGLMRKLTPLVFRPSQAQPPQRGR